MAPKKIRQLGRNKPWAAIFFGDSPGHVFRVKPNCLLFVLRELLQLLLSFVGGRIQARSFLARHCLCLGGLLLLNEPTISIEMILDLSMSSSGFSIDPAAVVPEGMGSSEVRAMTFLLMSSTSLARSSTRRVQDHTQSNQTQWVFQNNNLHFFWDHGLHSGQMEETGRQGKPSFEFLGHTTLTMKLKHQKLEKHSKILSLSGKRKWVIIWCHYSHPRAFVVYLSRAHVSIPSISAWVSAWAPSFC